MTRLITEKKVDTPPRISLLVLGAVSFIVMADMRVVDPLLRVIANEFGTSVGYTAAIVSAYTIPYGLFQLVYGPLGDRIGKLNVMTRAIAVFAIGTALCAFVPNLPLLILLRFLTGMFAAAIIPLSLAYIGDSFPYAERQTAIGRYLSSLMLGQILSSSLGGIFGEYLSWRDIFLLFGVVSLGIAAIFWQETQRISPQDRRRTQTSQEPDTPTKNAFAALKPYFQLMARPSVRIVIAAVFIEGFFLFGSFAYIGAFVRDRYNLPYVTIGLMLGGFGIGGLVYSVAVKWLVRHLGERGLVLLGGWLVGICYLAIALVQHWMLFVPSIVAIGLGFYMLHSTLQTRATELSPASRGTAVSLFAFHLFLGQGIGAAVLGQIVDRVGYIPVFIISGIAVPLLAVWFARQLKQLQRQTS